MPIVFDRYHVIQLMNQRVDALRRETVREATGPLELAVKGTRYLLLTRADNTGSGATSESWSGRSSSANRCPKAGT